MTTEQAEIAALKRASEERRRRAGLEPDVDEALRRVRQLQEIDGYWRERDRAAEENNR
jgi:hypothetical protein